MNSVSMPTRPDSRASAAICSRSAIPWTVCTDAGLGRFSAGIRRFGRMPLRIAVVGCGTAGPAAALLLARADHEVEVLERVPDPSPVGAGLLLQPTGMAVLRALGLLDEIERRGARVDRLHGETTTGRVVMDLAYADLEPGLHGLGLHRGALFGALFAAMREQKRVAVRTGV